LTKAPLIRRLACVALVLCALPETLATLSDGAAAAPLTESGFTTAFLPGSSADARQVGQFDLADAAESHGPVFDSVRVGTGQADGQFAHARRLGLRQGPVALPVTSPRTPSRSTTVRPTTTTTTVRPTTTTTTVRPTTTTTTVGSHKGHDHHDHRGHDQHRARCRPTKAAVRHALGRSPRRR
jgi:hypothetical protein